jgi:cytochrome c-type biogenesis protein CcmH
MIKKTIIVSLLPLLFLFVHLDNQSRVHAEELPLMVVEEVSNLIMSPGCDYKYTLSNCPSAEADQMRELVRDRLAGGETKEEILSYFESVYGPRILAQPAKRGFYFVAWWFPYFLLFDGFVLVGVILFMWRKKTLKDTAVSDNSIDRNTKADDSEIETLLEEEVNRFRGFDQNSRKT